MQSSCEHPAIASQSLGSYSVLCHYGDPNTKKRGRTKFVPFTETLKPTGLFGFLLSVAYIGLRIVAVACCPSVSGGVRWMVDWCPPVRSVSWKIAIDAT